MKKVRVHSILRYVESSWGFIQRLSLPGFNGVQCLEHFFVLRLEHPYIVTKSEKSLDMSELTSMPRKPQVADCSRKPKYTFSFSEANYSLKLHKKHSIKAAAHGIR